MYLSRELENTNLLYFILISLIISVLLTFIILASIKFNANYIMTYKHDYDRVLTRLLSILAKLSLVQP